LRIAYSWNCVKSARANAVKVVATNNRPQTRSLESDLCNKIVTIVKCRRRYATSEFEAMLKTFARAICLKAEVLHLPDPIDRRSTKVMLVEGAGVGRGQFSALA
jgi:hypothetical protein